MIDYFGKINVAQARFPAFCLFVFHKNSESSFEIHGAQYFHCRVEHL